MSPADIEFSPRRLLQPDLVVVPAASPRRTIYQLQGRARLTHLGSTRERWGQRKADPGIDRQRTEMKRPQRIG
jgi:hypothetical protein